MRYSNKIQGGGEGEQEEPGEHKEEEVDCT